MLSGIIAQRPESEANGVERWVSLHLHRPRGELLLPPCRWLVTGYGRLAPAFDLTAKVR
jgi:hypothetical protein